MKKALILTAAALLMAGCHCNKSEANAPESQAATVMENILARKSVRSFTGEAIPADVMEQLLRAAMAAPSGMNAQPWQMVVLTDKSQYDTLFAGNHNMRMLKESGAVVVMCADTMWLARDRNNPDAEPTLKANPLWRDDMGAVTENFLLAAEAYGLGACWTACYPFADRMEPIKKALGLPPAVVPYSVVPVGYPATANEPKDKWDTTRIHYGRW